MRYLILVVLGLLSTPAFALDWTKPILDQNNQPASLCDKDHPNCGKVLTLGEAASFALFAAFPDEREVTGEEKFKRAQLAMKIKTSKDYTPTAEEVADIKKLVAKAYSPLVVMRVWTSIDPGTKN